jgi:hypothetical protein
MKALALIAAILILVPTPPAGGQGACPVTIAPAALFTTPAPYPLKAPASNFWHGDERFWTMLPADGRWYGLPRNDAGLRHKVFWWYPGFDGATEPAPALKVTARQLDGSGTYTSQGPATNARHQDFGGWTILTGIDLPTAGCWELTGTYRGEMLTFVILVTA